MKRLTSLLLVILMLVSFVACSSQKQGEIDMNTVKTEINSKKFEDFSKSDKVTDYVCISVKDYGNIVVKLLPGVAPISVENFKNIVKDGLYDGTVFHRVYPGFMIQGGAMANGTTINPIKGEFSSNGVQNDLKHIRGVISMARTSVKDSATSQFFIMHADASSLDGNYAAFGYVVAGMEVVDEITTVECIIYQDEVPTYPTKQILMESVYFVSPN